MYAIINSGGKQCRVDEGEVIQVERLDVPIGEQVHFDEVLFIGDGNETRLGTPTIAEARVTGTVTEQGKAGKILVFKYKRRKKYRRLRGHRQPFTRVSIEKIELLSPAEKKSRSAKETQKEAKTEVKKRPRKETPKDVKKAAEKEGSRVTKETKKEAKGAVKKEVKKKEPTRKGTGSKKSATQKKTK